MKTPLLPPRVANILPQSPLRIEKKIKKIGLFLIFPVSITNKREKGPQRV
jgi:hypothetical protein